MTTIIRKRIAKITVRQIRITSKDELMGRYWTKRSILHVADIYLTNSRSPERKLIMTNLSSVGEGKTQQKIRST